MRFAGIIDNDIVDCDGGMCVSLWMQGCPHRCDGCHNPETWDVNGGTEIKRKELSDRIISLISKNGIKRNFSILGGEPLSPANILDTSLIIRHVRSAYPMISIYLWTGYLWDELEYTGLKGAALLNIARDIDCVIDGPYKKELRNTSLLMRGSSNQRIFRKKNGKWCAERGN